MSTTKEKQIARSKEYYERNKERIKNRVKLYSESDKAKIKKRDSNKLLYARKKEERKKQIKDYADKHPDKQIARSHKHQNKIKMVVMNHYGNDMPRCVCCGESHIEFLHIDHINGGGVRQRKEFSNSRQMYAWIINNDFPNTFRILCANCNMSKSAHGHCPHRYLPEDINYIIVAKNKLQINRYEKRLEVLSYYSNRTLSCACCGENHVEFLHIDHINNDGSEHRKVLTTNISSWIIRNGFPEGFRILCANCNLAKGVHGCCPHGGNR